MRYIKKIEISPDMSGIFFDRPSWCDLPGISYCRCNQEISFWDLCL